MPFKTPLFEALAEFNFAAVPLLEFRANTLYEIIGKEFPNYQRFPFFLVPAEIPGAQPAVPYSPAYRFTSQDGKRMIQYGPRLLTYHVYLYPGWHQFKEEFTELFSRVAEAGFGLVVERLALTYVNRMPAPTPQALQDLLSIDLGISGDTIPLDFATKRVDTNSVGVSTVTISPLPPSDLQREQAFGITCAELTFQKGAFSREFVAKRLDWFEAAHGRLKQRFWSMLRSEVQKEW